MRYISYFIILTISFCALQTGAQTLTNTYVSLADSADNYIKRERWEDAERVIIEALRHEPANPSNWLLWSNLGVVRTHRDNYEGALQAYEIGLSGAPKSTVLLNNRAWTRMSHGDSKDALSDLDHSLELDSLQPWPLKMRGLILMRSGNRKQARIDLSRSDALQPRDASVLAALGDLDAADGSLDKALDMYHRSLEVEKDPDISFRMLLIMTDKNDPKADEETIQALSRWPRHGTLHLIRAIQLKRKYQNDAAEKEKNLAFQYGADPLLIDQLWGNK